MTDQQLWDAYYTSKPLTMEDSSDEEQDNYDRAFGLLVHVVLFVVVVLGTVLAVTRCT